MSTKSAKSTVAMSESLDRISFGLIAESATAAAIASLIPQWLINLLETAFGSEYPAKRAASVALPLALPR